MNTLMFDLGVLNFNLSQSSNFCIESNEHIDIFEVFRAAIK